MKPMTPGLIGELNHVVREEDGAARWGNDVPVLATPVLLWLGEIASMRALAEHLDDGEMTVGTAHESAAHLAATPVGASVVVRSRLVAVDGKRLRFEIEATDKEERVYSGIHERAVVSVARFKERVAGKAARVLGHV